MPLGFDPISHAPFSSLAVPGPPPAGGAFEGLFGFIDFTGLPVGNLGTVPKGRGKTVAGRHWWQAVYHQIMVEEWKRSLEEGRQRRAAAEQRRVTYHELQQRQIQEAHAKRVLEVAAYAVMLSEL